jgi:hypothetical protein
MLLWLTGRHYSAGTTTMITPSQVQKHNLLEQRCGRGPMPIIWNRPAHQAWYKRCLCTKQVCSFLCHAAFSFCCRCRCWCSPLPSDHKLLIQEAASRCNPPTHTCMRTVNPHKWLRLRLPGAWAAYGCSSFRHPSCHTPLTAHASSTKGPTYHAGVAHVCHPSLPLLHAAPTTTQASLRSF